MKTLGQADSRSNTCVSSSLQCTCRIHPPYAAMSEQRQQPRPAAPFPSHTDEGKGTTLHPKLGHPSKELVDKMATEGQSPEGLEPKWNTNHPSCSNHSSVLKDFNGLSDLSEYSKNPHHVNHWDSIARLICARRATHMKQHIRLIQFKDIIRAI